MTPAAPAPGSGASPGLAAAPARRFRCVVVGGDGDVDERSFAVTAGRPMLDAIPRRPDSPIQVGCRGGGCGVCRVRVLEGEYTTKRMSRRFVTEEDEQGGYALACRLIPLGDLRVEWSPVRVVPVRS